MTRISLWKSISSGDLALIIVVAAGFVLYFTSGSYLTSPIEPVLLVVMGVFYLALNIWASHQLEYWTGWKKAVFFVVSVGLGTVIGIYSEGTAWMILLPLVSIAVQHLKTPMAAVVSILIWIGEVLPAAMTGNFGVTMSAAMGYLSAVVFVAVFTLIMVNEQKMRRELAAANDRLREYTHQLEEKTVLQERNRLAREIHDGLGHYLTSVNIQIKAAQAVLRDDPAAAQEAMTKAEYLTQEALNDVRRSVSALRVDQSAMGRISDAIQSLIPADNQSIAYGFRSTGQEVDLPPTIVWMLYRAGQELLTNIQKHSAATRVDIELAFDPSVVQLSVSDNGQGSSSLEGGFGLTGLRERVQILGGSMDVETSPGKGFSIRISVPIPTAEKAVK